MLANILCTLVDISASCRVAFYSDVPRVAPSLPACKLVDLSIWQGSIAQAQSAYIAYEALSWFIQGAWAGNEAALSSPNAAAAGPVTEEHGSVNANSSSADAWANALVSISPVECVYALLPTVAFRRAQYAIVAGTI